MHMMPPIRLHVQDSIGFWVWPGPSASSSSPLFLFIPWCICCIPWCIPQFKVFTHSCPSCKTTLGAHKGPFSMKWSQGGAWWRTTGRRVKEKKIIFLFLKKIDENAARVFLNYHFNNITYYLPTPFWLDRNGTCAKKNLSKSQIWRGLTCSVHRCTRSLGAFDKLPGAYHF